MLERVKSLFTRTLENFGYVRLKSWAQAFAIGNEFSFDSNRVTKPYAQVPSVYKAVKALCDNVPQAELIVRNYETQEETDSPAAREIMALLEKPNAEQSQNDFIQEVTGLYALYSEVIIVMRTSIGQMIGSRMLPAEIEAYNPKDVQKVRDNSGKITGYRIDKETYTPDQVIHIRDFNPYDKYCAVAPTEPLKNIIAIDWLTEIYNKAFFENNAAPPYALTTEQKLTEVQRNHIQQWLKEEHSGAKNAHKTPVLEGGLKPAQFGASHKDMDFLEQKRYSREEILGNWRTPKALFNITDDLNYATFQGQMKVFWMYGIMPILRKIEGNLNRKLITPLYPNLYIEFDTRNVPAFKEDMKDLAVTAETLSRIGFTRNEINEKLDLGFDDKPWGEYWWIPFSQMPAGESNDNPLTDNNPQDSGSAQDEQKAAGVKFDAVKFRAWKNFISKQAPVEKRLERVIARFLYEQRGRVLASLYKVNEKSVTKAQVSVVMDWPKEALQLIERVTPYIYQSMVEGLDIGEALAPMPDVDMDLLKSMVKANSAERAKRMYHVTETMAKRVSKVVSDGIQNGEAVDSIADKLRREYNIAGNRANMIARTESTGAVNDGSLLYYDQVGVKQIEWVTAHDENVRPSHVECEQEGPKRIGQTFSNGLRYPGDPLGSVAEVASCRCSLVPAIEK